MITCANLCIYWSQNYSYYIRGDRSPLNNIRNVFSNILSRGGFRILNKEGSNGKNNKIGVNH